MEPPFVAEMVRRWQTKEEGEVYLSLSNLSKVQFDRPCIANVDDCREAYVMLTKNGATAFKWQQCYREEMVVTFAPQTIQQWTAAADGLRMWMSREPADGRHGSNAGSGKRRGGVAHLTRRFDIGTGGLHAVGGSHYRLTKHTEERNTHSDFAYIGHGEE